LLRPKRESRRFLILHRPAPALPIRAPFGSPDNANQLVNRVVQKALFQNPEFIGFFALIFANRAGPLATDS
jgi:hypothetical protein